MDQKIKVGIIGLGFMGSTHFRIYQENDKAQVIALADIDDKKLSGDWSGIVGNIGDSDNNTPVDLSNYKLYKQAELLIQNPEIDLVDICLPTDLHYEFIKLALENGKNVFCEKPFARTKEQARELMELAKSSKGFLTIGMCIRYWPEYQYIFKRYTLGDFGKIISAGFKRFSPNIAGNAWKNWFMDNEKSGGALFDLHIHDSDVIRYFFGRPHSVSSYGISNFRCKNGVDQCVTIYDYKNDSLIYAEGGWAMSSEAPFEMGFKLICQDATISFTGADLTIYWENRDVEKVALDEAVGLTGWHREIDYILSEMAGNSVPDRILQFEQLADSVCIAEAEAQSIISKKKEIVSY